MHLVEDVAHDIPTVLDASGGERLAELQRDERVLARVGRREGGIVTAYVSVVQTDQGQAGPS